MVSRWLNSSSERLADFYDLVRDNHALLGTFAVDDRAQEDLLITRAELERRGYLTPEMVEADRIVVAEGLHESYDYSAYGPEWPLCLFTYTYLHKIRAGRFDPQRLPGHLCGVVSA